MAHKKDTDYLAISTQIRSMEKRMLGRDRLERMIDAQTDGEALKLLSECGYGSSEELKISEINQILEKSRADAFGEIRAAISDRSVVDVFQVKYDYHNAKVLIKSRSESYEQMGHLLLEGGRYDPSQLLSGFHKEEYRGVSDTFRQAVKESREALASTQDPQISDLILDRACYQEMVQLAQESGSKFLQGYVRLAVDVANLRAAVRVSRMERGSDFLKQVLLPGGNVSTKSFLSTRAEELGDLFHAGALAEAAQLGSKVVHPGSGSLTAFERECDNALVYYLGGARMVPFGEQVVIAYLCAKESELTAIRTVLAGRRAGLDGSVIRERLRNIGV